MVAVVSQCEEKAVPKGDSKSGENGISEKGLLGGPGDKGDVSAADRDDAGEADCYFPMIAKGAVRR